jgi:hypothetical protein
MIVMKRGVLPGLVAGVLCAAAGAAAAQSPEYMVEDCKLASQQFYQEFQGRTEAKYEGQRTDGTHAVNGTIDLKDRSTYYSCSYNADGTTLVEFFAEKKSWPDFVKGGGSPYKKDAAGEADSTIDVGGVKIPKKALDSCVGDAASAMSVGKDKIKVVKAGQEGADNYYIEVAAGKKHLVCAVNSKGEIFDTRYGTL